MPSPFPSMDPYIERSGWHSLHHSLIMYAAEQMQPKLIPHYVAQLDERVENVATPPNVTFYEKRLIPFIQIITVETRDVVTQIDALCPTDKVAEGHQIGATRLALAA